jgi:class 3 adenylate cyclase/tetratricopeptide (TPR) repeat protein
LAGRANAEAALTRSSRARDGGQERKVATLVFADIVGFTNLNERRDPELVSSRTGALFERLSREVQRYEGTIEKFAGDAMLAVFGVPAAHEDDPERAVRSALEMQAVVSAVGAAAEAGSALQLRIGIETGEVLVDQTRAASERDLFVTGNAVNTAARLQGIADPGTVVVGPSTYAATRDVVDYEELPPVELKGKAFPLAAWRAGAIKAGRGGRRSRLGLQAPLVGRNAELALLKETVRRAADDGSPHLVTVLGSAGVGKSRLTWELEKYLDGLPGTFHWRKGRCLAYSGPSFGPIADVVKVDARIQDDDRPDAAREKLATRLDELALGGDKAAVRDALEAVLAIGDPRDRPRDELFEAWRKYLGAIADVAPLVLVVEDIHWADDGVLSFLDFLARWGDGPVVILCLARHELVERRSGWGGGVPNATTIVLTPLSADASSALMAGLLDGGVPLELGARITELAEGNPLFVEEMVRMLVDRGVLRFSDGRWELASAVDQVDIPSSVQAVLAARLDTLPPDEKRVAQDAAVIGRIFWDIVVAHLSGSGRDPTNELIRRLRVKDLVVQRQPSALAEASEYGFRHVLIRDVAYDSLPKRDRSRLHRDIALWAETELTDRIEEFSELIASHLAAALAYEEEFVEDPVELEALRRLAMDAAVRAARRATAVSQFGSAGRWLKLAMELAGKLDLAPRAYAERAVEYAREGWENADPAERDVVLSRAIEGMLALEEPSASDAELLAQLRDQRGHALYDLGDVEGARALLRLGIADLEPGPPSAGRALLLNRLGWTYWRAGPLEEARPVLERAISEAKASSSDATLRWATHDLGITFGFLSRFDESVHLLEESFRQARESGDGALLLRCYINLPAVRQGRGDEVEPLIAMVEEGLQLARRSAASHTIVWLAGNRADFMVDLGRLDEALTSVDESVVHAQMISSPHLAPKLSMRARLHLMQGDVDAAQRDLDEAARLGPSAEPQTAVEYPLSLAFRRWPDHPREAMESLATWALGATDTAAQNYSAALEVARMALRAADVALAARMAELYREKQSSHLSPLHEIKGRWIDALSGAGDHAVLEQVATDMEGLGYRVHAADAWADAALVAARDGSSPDAEGRASDLYGAMGMHPLLGPLPETRWLAPAEAAGSTPAA